MARPCNRPPQLLAPTQNDIWVYDLVLQTRHRRMALQYRTGPRFGQQLAEYRALEAMEISTRPGVP